MAAKQGITTETIRANNPKAKYKVNYIRYRIYNNDGTYTYGKKYITRKNNE
jgi:hypothetical protein